jgi:quercetin dioxygenase-like cupin family protein
METGRYVIRRNLDRLKENPKIAAFQPGAPWGERWVPARFIGFSYLLDNPGNSLITSQEGIPLLHCDASAEAAADLILYRTLVTSLKSLELQLRPYAFCPLSPASYHVTLWDGINQSNAGSLTMAKRAEYETFAGALPASIAGPASPILPPSVVSIDQHWSLKFRFKKLHIWTEAAALVALLEPADDESKAAMDLLEQHRQDLDVQYAAIGKPQNHPWAPHVSCGYFKTTEDASAAKRHLNAWTEVLKGELADASIAFSSASLYSFTNMERFYRHPLPAVSIALPVIQKAIAEKTGFIGERGDQKILITYQYGYREQLAKVAWQPLARSGNKHYCVTPYGLDVAVFDERAAQSRHYHRAALELYRVLEGTMTICVSGVKHVIAAGEEIVVAPHAVHEVIPDTPFLAMVVVANTTGTADKFASEPWTAPDGFAAPGAHLRPTTAMLEEDGSQIIFRYGPKLRISAFDERQDGQSADGATPATRLVSVLTGSMTLDVNGDSYDLHAGDSILVFPRAARRWELSGAFRAEILTLDC